MVFMIISSFVYFLSVGVSRLTQIVTQPDELVAVIFKTSSKMFSFILLTTP